ncbi:hypothetical protein MHK_011013 [Candidatus Magnetomorum sp. HK-1]|nr:hypothetical protein MHK_011013 [Candidatus Magnetomorum sp. HK-1]
MKFFNTAGPVNCERHWRHLDCGAETVGNFGASVSIKYGPR